MTRIFGYRRAKAAFRQLRNRNILRFGMAGALVLAVAGCQLLGPDLPTAADIGAREHPRVVATYGGVYEDSGAEHAVASVVGRLVAASEDPSQTYKITILNSPAVNAFALPGGYLYVTRGLLALAPEFRSHVGILRMKWPM